MRALSLVILVMALMTTFATAVPLKALAGSLASPHGHTVSSEAPIEFNDSTRVRRRLWRPRAHP
ncbi:uncharacterized protein TRAVEDRAFT_60768 [Trametes versicolor FP-101664 SS1]|uniref:uncharacterized protein n=1 Tax=Trametes versicolor (strain FP-101664) TaxID=717944 RepID=UPI00046222B9|nr:uncharacterized protein TRAVEDRAFT_60768 [Trametes versicolor FP-101664 SS1]EIW53225.1 hypothetical protein TRAVEDRAFT_60768 [Trametes versicolor FP-101664 SS1]